MSRTAKIRNAIRRQVAEALKPHGHSWINVANAVLKKEGRRIPTLMTKGQARTIVLAYARGAGYSVPQEPAKPKPSKPSNYKQISDAFFSSDRWKELRYEALKNCGAKCLCCGASAQDGAVIHVDHIKPRYHYPELQWDLSNLQVLCADCNYGKRAWDETDWRTDAMRDQMDHMKSIKNS